MGDSSGQTRERWSYDVFLSFRGPDVRSGFLSHLYKSLVRSGIYTFKDDRELEIGESIPPELMKAIKNSKIYVVVLSESYASSSWCLDELVHIMRCLKNDPGHLVFPVFYKIEPSHVRRQSGPFGESFHKHRIMCTSRESKWKGYQWRKALTSIANLKGYHSSNGDSDAELIDQLTRDILRVLPSSYLHLPTYAVGIRPRVGRIKELMCFGLDDVQIIGIWGMAGIGKTTLAKAAFNEFSHRFEGRSFLENFRDYFKRPDGKLHLQKKLLSDILRKDEAAFNNMDHAVKQRFRNKRVLVVIDDVEDIVQLHSVGIYLSCFGPGSRIIITTKNKHLLEQLDVENIYSPKELNADEALDLVSWHAFRSSEPPEEFLQFPKRLVEYCGGLPLAMEVLGAFLYKRSVSEWKSTLKALKRIPDDNIQAKLQISFDALNASQKDIFLDISCFFIGMDKDYVDCILDGCELEPVAGLKVLKERCLITIHDNSLMMHDLLRDMGRYIVKGTSLRNCERWSRLWDREHVIDVLANYSGTDETEGLSLKADVTAVENFEVKAFSILRKLRLLQLCHVALNGSYENFPKGFRWLCWLGFPEESFPINLHLRSLVVMDMQKSNLKRLWSDQKPHESLKELKYLDLSHSIQLTETPDFSYLPNLEKLFLINCQRLAKVHESIKVLQGSLILINLSGCIKLGELPLELYTLKLLETLILSGCSQLERLDDALGELESLTILKADYTAITQIPSSSDQLKKLKELSLHGCKELWKHRQYTNSDESSQVALLSPLSLNGLICLRTLRLGSCNLSDELVPANLGSLSSLEELDLQGNNFRNLQTDFAGLPSLQILKLDNCSELRSMFSLPKKLRSLYARNCTVLERTPDLLECSVLQSLHLTNCYNLVETPGLEELKTVGAIHMEMCNNIPYSDRERIMQGWAVGANGGVFVPGSTIPEWVNFKNGTRSISFTVPEPTLNSVLVGFTVWTTYVSQQDDVMSVYIPKITLKNQTKGDVWSRNPATDLIRMYREKHIWQGHFSNEDFLLETRDEVEVSVDFGDKVAILETGLTLAYREVPEVPIEQLTETGDEVDNEQLTETDDEVVIDESQRRPPRKMGMGLKTLLGAFGLLAFIVVLGKHGRPLRRHNHLRRNEVEKDKEKNATLPIFSFLDY
ncbi:PREDICTED: TMV resistance protein N-like isoform X2 [Brassica oleracea var. oleracea]|nr:PREDICTED: TMV resistance protein N-like isoform X2 [Brassica oleracea var. oleracea]XP_013620606.1 PREDICTED: TMV resistance protein N-like isoform X2 [Brassica oleracea var. oleracea]XP_013620607.1 PREDICTED: TMV resistance protein N-like isoform X2 [Brassica oleracea var. oleracea]XP_013620608.1 PREDICTED: TMV resistance protein N-like isoform X2 [Brassica oleracea var. oleracea]XP_013620609.1 PREDICTED: TMV resistance protein N-like isoform X2 [Brassica oleracea var. oleracea]XP_0136206